MTDVAANPARGTTPPPGDDVLPSLFRQGWGAYAPDRRTFVVSAVLHVVVVALVVVGSIYLVSHKNQVQQQVMAILTTDSLNLPLRPAKTQAGGGGGGGDRDKLAASKGHAPKFASEQLAAPRVVIHNPEPKLSAEPTVLGPPQIQLPQLGAMGDPTSKILGPPSNGTGSGGGIGSGTGTGVGSGLGAGVGPGRGGGSGGGYYRPGVGGVSVPRVIDSPDPEYSDEARRAKYQGTVVLWVVVGPDGRVHDIRVQRTLGMGLDERAVEAVKRWKFEPARKDGQPVAVQVNIEVRFTLY
jgi:TonB family protein